MTIGGRLSLWFIVVFINRDACGKDDDVCVYITRNRNGKGDLFLEEWGFQIFDVMNGN